MANTLDSVSCICYNVIITLYFTCWRIKWTLTITKMLTRTMVVMTTTRTPIMGTTRKSSVTKHSRQGVSRSLVQRESGGSREPPAGGVEMCKSFMLHLFAQPLINRSGERRARWIFTKRSQVRSQVERGKASWCHAIS